MTLPRFDHFAFLCASFLMGTTLTAGCDFAPVLDIDLPDYQPGTVINAVLVADSVAVVRLSVSVDPYASDVESRPLNQAETNPDAVVTLMRDGQPMERLRVRPKECFGLNRETGDVFAYECGPFVSASALEAGGRYTIRVEQPGLPVAEGTVTLPQRPVLTVTEEAPLDNGRRRFQVRVTDPAGRGERYGVSLVRGPFREQGQTCEVGASPPVCRDTTYVIRQPTYFSSSDPVILAGARNLDLDDAIYRFASVDDQSFDGRTWSFTMTASGSGDFYDQYASRDVFTIQIAGLSGDVYDAYQISAFGGQDEDNPFTEPVNLPTNVSGGYGLVAGLALAEVTFPARETQP